MFHTRTGTLAIAALLTAATLPAAAATSVKVNVAGQDAKAAHVTIVHAAKTACQAELRDASTFEHYYLWSDCLNTAVARAQVSLEANKIAAAAPITLARR
jgi:hypothetical protein